MAFDFKKEYKEFYLPPQKPGLADVPAVNYLAVRGKGDPNAEDGEYAAAMGLLYAVAYTLKMSPKAGHKIEGYFEYVVPPLEGFWWQPGAKEVDYSRKDAFEWISVIRLPDFVTRNDFAWALAAATEKKKQDFTKVEFFAYEEGLCVQCMHVGSYDNEPATLKAMEAFANELGYDIDITDKRMHHEIYLSDPRKVEAEKLKTVIRHPVKARQK